MGRIWNGPATAVAAVALAVVVAVAGTALAGPRATTARRLSGKEKRQVKKISKKQANRRIDKRESSLNVNSAKSADTATNASNADSLGGLTAAAIQKPRGRALVDSAGNFAAGYPRRGIAAVGRPDTGIYCLTPSDGLDPNSDPPIVTVEWNHSLGDDLLAYWAASAEDCPANRWEVRTYDFEGGSTNASNDVAFQIVVP